MLSQHLFCFCPRLHIQGELESGCETSVPKRHVDEWTVPPSPSRVPAWMANAYNGGSASGPDKYQPTLSSVQDGFKEQGSETYVNSGATTSWVGNINSIPEREP